MENETNIEKELTIHQMVFGGMMVVTAIFFFIWLILFIGLFIVGYFLDGFYFLLLQKLMVKFLVLTFVSLLFVFLLTFENIFYQIFVVIIFSGIAFYQFASFDLIADILNYHQKDYEVVEGYIENPSFVKESRYSHNLVIDSFTLNNETYYFDMYRVYKEDYEELKNDKIKIYYLKNSHLVVDYDYINESF